MDKRYLYLLIPVVILAYLTGGQTQSPTRLETYEANDPGPYGTEVLRKLLPRFFLDKTIEDINEPMLNRQTAFEFSLNSNLIFISKDLDFSLPELEIMRDFMEKGNDIFVSADDFNPGFLSEFDLTIEDRVIYSGDSIHLKYSHPKHHAKEALSPDFVYHYFTLDSSFDGKVLGTVERDTFPFFIRVPVGSGNLLIHLQPRIFSNQEILRGEDHAELALSYLKLQDTYWDNYHKTYKRIKEHKLTYIKSNPPLWIALRVLLMAGLLFIFFEAKRRQRAIPVIKAPRNESLNFIRTIANLYFNEGKHREMADKKIQHFYQEVYARLNINRQDTAFLEKLQKKTGMEPELLDLLQAQLNYNQRNKTFTQKDLLELNNVIDTCYERIRK
ncbi:MAG: DUF4350 domain-containing protein [Bacteroidetes bacterium]|nr:MAG: DUF4350 domain-containing protein [Bacteroidota bacterium]